MECTYPLTCSSLLLTNPVSLGYNQNPISVYYCFDGLDDDLKLEICLAEVGLLTCMTVTDQPVYLAIGFEPLVVPTPLSQNLLVTDSLWWSRLAPVGHKHAMGRVLFVHFQT